MASTPRRSCVTSTRASSGNGVREWELVADEKEIEVAPGVKYAAWAYNGRVPGPTLRAREGEAGLADSGSSTPSVIGT